MSRPEEDPAGATLAELATSLAAGRLSARELAEYFLARIDSLDRAGPTLRAVIEVNPDALALADDLDREPRRGPLHGIPVLIKDNIDTGDRMLTTAGSLALAGGPAPADARVVRRLRQAGVLILGKTNLSEWANFRSTRSCSGWSARGGQTRNPHVLDRSPCGSSSGSAAAAAAGLAAVTVGTETDGSIVCPSAANGVVGIKPTVGLVSQQGIIPISTSQDSAGPHARSVADAARLLGAMTGTPRDYGPALARGSLRGARIGVLRQPYTGYSEQADAVYESALALMAGAGADLVEATLATADELRESGTELTVLTYEFNAGIARYLAGRPGIGIRDLAGLIAFNQAHESEEMPYFRQERFEDAEARGTLDESEYRRARRAARRLAGREGIDATLTRHQLAALVAPTTVPAWVVDPINGDRVGGASSQPAAMAGYPSISVPAGLAHGALPVGISFFGRAHDEAGLIGLAHAFELLRGPAPRPRYLETLELP